MKPTHFRTTSGQSIPLPVFFPDATRAILKSLDTSDIESTQTPGLLVNTYHLYRELGKSILKSHKGVRPFMSWSGGLITDSGGFQVMSIAKANAKHGAVTDRGVTFAPPGAKKILFTPAKSIEFQMRLKPDMLVVLDDFTPNDVSYEEAQDTVRRTLLWAKQSKTEFERLCHAQNIPNDQRPYLLGVVQGGQYLDLRAFCTQELVKIGFDGLGYGGWPIDKEGNFQYDIAQIIRKHTPENYLLYGLGIGMPEEVAALVRMGYHIFDCVLPTRDARHGRLYVYNAHSIDDITITNDFYSFYYPEKEIHYADTRPISTACDCLLCTRYTRAYLAHLFRIGDHTAGRLATIHNLRFYSLLMQKLQTP